MYESGPAEHAAAPILITHFEGAFDAGNAGSLSTEQLLRHLNPRRVATFDSDRLIDYRSHRPVLVVEDWVTTDVRAPEIALDLLRDDAGAPILLLHGPEPDARWETFAQNVGELASKAGVELMVSLRGFPAAVPHTRPTSVLLQSTEAALVPQQTIMDGNWQFPAPLTEFLQNRVSKSGTPGVSLFATVPYYMSDSPFPRAASSLLRRLADMCQLSLPIGDLEQGADEEDDSVQHLIERSPEVSRTVEALENHFDAMVSQGELRVDGDVVVDGTGAGKPGSASGARADSSAPSRIVGLDELAALDAAQEDESMADQIGEAIERYLQQQNTAGSNADEEAAHGERALDSGEEEDSRED